MQQLRLALAALLPVLLAAECRTTQGPANAVAENTRGEVEGTILDAWLARCEKARGLGFVRRPLVDLVEAGDPRLAALLAAMPIALVRPSGMLSTEPLAHTAVDFRRQQILAARPVAEDEVRVALGFLLDAQHYPSLIDAAARAPGDVGLTLRALLVASAYATANGGLGPTPEEPSEDPYLMAELEIEEPDTGTLFGPVPVFTAEAFLRSQGDREAAFRAPPLSTEQLLRPPLWHAGDRPVALRGPPPVRAGCTIASDESFGLYALVRSLLRRSGKVPGRILAAWRGDRAILWHCSDGSKPWIYAIDLDDESAAQSFASAGEVLMSPDWPAADGVARHGRRVVFSRGFAPARVAAFAASLSPLELRRAGDAIAPETPGP